MLRNCFPHCASPPRAAPRAPRSSCAAGPGTRTASAFAPGAKIGVLVPEKALALLELATRGDFVTPTCPACAIKMVKRKSTARGRPYWGCRNYPGCKNTFFVT